MCKLILGRHTPLAPLKRGSVGVGFVRGLAFVMRKEKINRPDPKPYPALSSLEGLRLQIASNLDAKSKTLPDFATHSFFTSLSPKSNIFQIYI